MHLHYDIDLLISSLSANIGSIFNVNQNYSTILIFSAESTEET